MILEATVALLLQPRAVIQPDPQLLAERTATEPRSVWDRLAECESGEWINGGEAFVGGSARWDASEGTFRGGIQYLPQTWVSFARKVLGDEAPSSAHLASREQQIRVGKEVLRVQGVRAWPTCGPMVGLTMNDAQ